MTDAATQIDRFKRPPDVVMHLERMGCFHQTRISFMRSLIRRMSREKWRIARTRWNMDDDGYGEAVYTVHTPQHAYSLVVFSNALNDAERTDRVIAEKWDTTFTLFDGEPSADDIERLRRCVPLQEAGRCSAMELVLSRANKSVRLFNYVVDCLSQGQQPEMSRLAEVGYLMRTTAVYGNGKFGVADRQRIMHRADMAGPYRAELLTVYLIRCFTHDLVDHIAQARGGSQSVALSRERKKVLGIGNATGLGMAPYLHKHPLLINNWFDARETALARVRAVQSAGEEKKKRFHELLQRAQQHVRQWHTDDKQQTQRIETLKRDLEQLANLPLKRDYPWHTLMTWAEKNVSVEAQEMLVSLLLEPYPELVDELEETMAADEDIEIDALMTANEVRLLIEQEYDWALKVDFTQASSMHWFWYVSEEKLEPRIGARFEESGADKELPLGVAREVQQLHTDLIKLEDGAQSIAYFLVEHPEYCHIVRRVQCVRSAPYGEIRDNLLAREMRPVDILRSKLSFFGATKFDPKSDRWTRIAMYQAAPLPDELPESAADDWCFPVIAA